MNRCCVESLCFEGIRTGFRLAEEGETHTCRTCKTVQVLRNGQWATKGSPPTAPPKPEKPKPGKEEKPDEELLTVEQVCKLLKIKPGWIYQHVHFGTLPFPLIKLGHYLRFRRGDVMRYLDGRTYRPK